MARCAEEWRHRRASAGESRDGHPGVGRQYAARAVARQRNRPAGGRQLLGQFLSPLAVLGLRDLTGSLSKAILVYAIACGISGIAAPGSTHAIMTGGSLRGLAPFHSQ
jgi:hypothetical protein